MLTIIFNDSYQAKIKRMMQSNEDIPKIANSVPVLIGTGLGIVAFI